MPQIEQPTGEDVPGFVITGGAKETAADSRTHGVDRRRSAQEPRKGPVAALPGGHVTAGFENHHALTHRA
jgi:hypothetical protein